MAITAGSLRVVWAGSRLRTEVRFQVWPFQCATVAPPKAQMLVADSALPPCRPCPEDTFFQLCPL